MRDEGGPLETGLQERVSNHLKLRRDNARCAISVNIEIMRTFMRLRSALLASKELAERVHSVERTQIGQEKELGEHAVHIHELFAAMRHLAAPRRNV